MNKLVTGIAVVLAFLVAITMAGLWAGRRKGRDKESFFLGGRTFTWPLIGMCIFATNISSMNLVGQSGLAYEIGIAAANPQLMGSLMLGLSAVFFIPVYLRTRLLTVPAFLEMRFNRTAKVIYSLTIVTTSLLIAPFLFYAGGLTFLEMFGLSPEYLWMACLLMGVAVGLYSVFGGLAAVVVTDLLQSLILLSGGLLVAVFAGLRLLRQGPMDDDTVSRHLELLLPASHPEMPWTGVFTGLLLASIFFAVCNAGILQRVLGARNLYHAQMGMLLGAFLKVLALFVLVLPGVFARYLLPGINPDAAFATMVREFLPAGLSSIVMAGFLAALTSSTDAGLLMISSIVTLDLYPLFDPAEDEKRAVGIGRLVALLVLAWAVLAAPFCQHMGLIFPLMLKVSAYTAAPIMVCYLLGRFSRRINHQAAVGVLVLGYLIGLPLVLFTTLPWLKPLLPAWLATAHFYHISTFLTLVYGLLLFFLSLLFPPPPATKLAFLAPSPAETLAGPSSAPALPLLLAALALVLIALYLVF